MTKFFIKDAEAAVYALEAAICLFSSMTSGNYGQAALDLITLVGWVRNSF